MLELQKKVLRYAEISPQHLHSWQKKARYAALLPRLQLDYSRRNKSDIDLDINDNVYVGSSGVVVGPEENTYQQTDSFDHNIGVRAVWSLNEFVFNQDQLQVSIEARNLLRARNDVLTQANHFYFERQKLLKISSTDKLDLAHVTAQLDALTGGWFSEHVQCFSLEQSR
ncbi:MAG: hypothetical protein COV43_06920 [Deltaproteobacteria bacterium CG11_big_fil_rev_8_21_14_0_20_42_23]|nr:MAG: hypothetical protein COV43_06920 [Deltaproteobacteria bacterium CG11_big_fil_rev_8_21_14_0_20_42_23]PJC65246.1 MAG: hypothetical protein CO021_00225 [Deltaproteobacteria bacterium CG_4_9_14_0_2_um_filter_42_21]